MTELDGGVVTAHEPTTVDQPPRRLLGQRLRGWTGRNRTGLVIFALAWLTGLTWWAAYYPGLFSPDSLAYIYQATTSHWDTHHSVLYDGLVWLSLYGTGGLSVLTFAQVTALAAGLGYAAAELRRLGTPALALVIASVGLVALPSVGTFIVCVWKDVPFAIASVFVLGTMARILRRRLELPADRLPVGLLVGLGVELAVISLMRPNGFVVVGLAGVLAAAFWRGVRWRVLLVGVAAAALAVLANFAIFPALGVVNSFGEASSGPTTGDIAVMYVQHPEDFGPADLDLMRAVAPLSVWHDSATCATSDSTIYAPGFTSAVAAARVGDLTALWARLVRTDPGAIIAIRLCRGRVGWLPAAFNPSQRLIGNPVSGYRSFLSPDFMTSPYADAVFAKPLSNRLHRWVTE